MSSKEFSPFNTEGKLWEVNRESVVILAGGRALLMQLAHPLVAQAVKDTGFMLKKPYERLHRTSQAGFGLVFGTEDKVNEIAKTINTVHDNIRGFLEESNEFWPRGTIYDATNPELLQWVAATIIDSSISGFEKFVRPLQDNEKDKYLKDALPLFQKLRIDRENFPNSYNQLTFYIQEMIDSGKVEVGATARKLAPYALLRYSTVRNIITFPLFKVTVGLLPEKLRQQYGYSWSAWEEKLLAQSAKFSQKVLPFLPKELRFVLQYLQVRQILNSKSNQEI